MRFWRNIELTRAGWLGAALALSVGLILYFLPAGNGLVRLSFDTLTYAKPVLTPEEVVLVYLDEWSRRELDQPLSSAWDRGLHARLVKRLQSSGAKVVVFDILFSQPGSDPDADRALAEAIRDNGRVVLAANYEVGATGLNGATVRSGSLVLPMGSLKDAAAGWGLVNMPWDDDLAIRSHLPHQPERPSLAWKTFEVLQGTNSASKREGRRWLTYYGEPGALPSVSFSQALYPDGVPTDFFQGKVIFVGARQSTGFLGQGKDEFRTPYSRFTGTLSPGVEIQATAFLNLLRGDDLRQFSLPLELGLLAAAGLGLGLVLAGYRREPGSEDQLISVALAPAVLALVGLLLVPLLAWVCVRTTGYWFAWMLVEAQLLVALLCALTFNVMQAYVERRTAELRAENLQLEHDKLALEKQTLEHSLSLHLSPGRVHQLLERPELLRPGSERMEVSILFSDIAVYSKLAETLESEDLVRLLNSYYEVALGCVYETDGTVLQLVGDAIFAIWNAPFPQADHAERACRSALMLAEKLDNFGVSEGGMPFRTRIGLHAGLTHVGNIGSSKRFAYVATGRNVNLASRLEGLNKYLNTQVLATREVVKQVEKSLQTRRLGFFRFKGFGQLTEVYEVLGLAQPGQPQEAWVTAFEEASRQYCARRFDAASSGFREAIELRKSTPQEQSLSPEFRVEDGPSRFYLDQIQSFRTQPPEAEWMGETSLDDK